MAIQLTCDCGKHLRAKDELAGKRVKCPSCGKVLQLPQLAIEAEDGAYNLEPPGPTRSAPTSPSAPPVRRTIKSERPATPEDVTSPSPDYETQDEEERPRAPVRKIRKTVRRRKTAYREEPAATGGVREYLYVLLIFALIPLTLSVFQKDEGDIEARLVETIQHAPKETQAKVGRILSDMDAGKATVEDLFAAFPDGRIEGALLPRKSWIHWLFAFGSATVFLALILLMFPTGSAKAGHLLLVGLFTATIGILFLIIVQYVAMWTQGVWLRGRGVIVLVFYILKFIGFSYRSALDPESNWFLSFLGFTAGVGLCEELCKALPLLWHFRRSGGLTWRAACLWGLATGVGFGVSEGITYSSDFYNGFHAGGVYVVRFISCVALHAVWSASVAITLYRNQWLIQGDADWLPFSLGILRIIAVAMVLHGLYDTLLKKDMSGLALLVALVSFGWLACQIEFTRHTDEEESPAPARALA
jgi:RsiW-degrading membrane proteinase PrsW (M82 family)